MNQDLRSDLANFTGTMNLYKHWSGHLEYTDGIKYLADKAGANWLIDAIASYQPELIHRGCERFQSWQLTVNREPTIKGPMAVLTMREDSDRPEIIRQKIDFTDFPLDEISFFVVNRALMLTTEY